MNTNNTTEKTKNIILETYEFAPRTVRIKDEDELLFQVYPSIDYKRSKKDADEIAKHIVKAVNSHDMLLDIAKRAAFIFGNEANYPEGTIGYTLCQAAKEAINKTENL